MCVVRGSTCHCQCWVEVEGMVEAPHHRHQPPHIRDWSLPITSLQSPQSPQCPHSAQLTETLSFIISAHSLHGGPALSTASAPSPAAIVELSLESLDTPALVTIPYILDTRNTGGCGLGWPSDMSATHWILFQRSVQVVRVWYPGVRRVPAAARHRGRLWPASGPASCQPSARMSSLF